MKITLGPVNCGVNGTAYDYNTIKFDSKKEQEKFFEVCKKTGIKVEVKYQKSCCLESDRTCTDCGSCNR